MTFRWDNELMVFMAVSVHLRRPGVQDIGTHCHTQLYLFRYSIAQHTDLMIPH